MKHPEFPAQNVLKGISLILTAVVIFACMDTVGKYLMTKFNVPFVSAVRYGLNLLLLMAIMMPRYGSGLWKTTRTGLVVFRGLSLAAASFFAGLALQRMPVGESVAIFYLQTFGMLLAAGYFLNERITLPRWIAAAVGFAGVLFIARPGSELAPLGVLFALICAGVSVVYVLLSRLLAPTDSTMAMMFYTGLAGVAVFGAMLPWNWPDVAFTIFDVAMLLFLGAASLAGHFLFTAAFRLAPASILAPFNYFHIAFAVMLSWLVYHHVPDVWSFVGMAMIAISGVAVSIYNHRTKSSEV